MKLSCAENETKKKKNKQNTYVLLLPWLLLLLFVFFFYRDICTYPMCYTFINSLDANECQLINVRRGKTKIKQVSLHFIL